MKSLTDDPQRQYLTLSKLFLLQFHIIENDNDTGWADKLSHVGSEGTDALVKAMINIMLINVFKAKMGRKFGDFDLAGIHIFLSEFHAHLGARASFLIPEDIGTRLLHGSKERYNNQYQRFWQLKTGIKPLQSLIDLINKHHRCYDQEGYIDMSIVGNDE